MAPKKIICRGRIPRSRFRLRTSPGPGTTGAQGPPSKLEIAKLDDKFDEIFSLTGLKYPDSMREVQGVSQNIDRLAVLGGDPTNLFVSIICSPLLIPVHFDDIPSVWVVNNCFLIGSNLLPLLKRLVCFFPAYSLFSRLAIQGGWDTVIRQHRPVSKSSPNLAPNYSRFGPGKSLRTRVTT